MIKKNSIVRIVKGYLEYDVQVSSVSNWQNIIIQDDKTIVQDDYYIEGIRLDTGDPVYIKQAYDRIDSITLVKE